VELAGKQGDEQQPAGIEHVAPFALELEHDGGLERLHLGVALRLAQGLQRDAKQRQ
jgi:hypothetical protein